MHQHHQQTAGESAHDECEFCSPEPEIMPAPWERGSEQDDRPAAANPLDEQPPIPETVGEPRV